MRNKFFLHLIFLFLLLITLSFSTCPVDVKPVIYTSITISQTEELIVINAVAFSEGTLRKVPYPNFFVLIGGDITINNNKCEQKKPCIYRITGNVNGSAVLNKTALNTTLGNSLDTAPLTVVLPYYNLSYTCQVGEAFGFDDTPSSSKYYNNINTWKNNFANLNNFASVNMNNIPCFPTQAIINGSCTINESYIPKQDGTKSQFVPAPAVFSTTPPTPPKSSLSFSNITDNNFFWPLFICTAFLGLLIAGSIVSGSNPFFWLTLEASRKPAYITPQSAGLQYQKKGYLFGSRGLTMAERYIKLGRGILGTATVLAMSAIAIFGGKSEQQQQQSTQPENTTPSSNAPGATSQNSEQSSGQGTEQPQAPGSGNTTSTTPTTPTAVKSVSPFAIALYILSKGREMQQLKIPLSKEGWQGILTPEGIKIGAQAMIKPSEDLSKLSFGEALQKALGIDKKDTSTSTLLAPLIGNILFVGLFFINPRLLALESSRDLIFNNLQPLLKKAFESQGQEIKLKNDDVKIEKDKNKPKEVIIDHEGKKIRISIEALKKLGFEENLKDEKSIRDFITGLASKGGLILLKDGSIILANISTDGIKALFIGPDGKINEGASQLIGKYMVIKDGRIHLDLDKFGRIDKLRERLSDQWNVVYGKEKQELEKLEKDKRELENAGAGAIFSKREVIEKLDEKNIKVEYEITGATLMKGQVRLNADQLKQLGVDVSRLSSEEVKDALVKIANNGGLILTNGGGSIITNVVDGKLKVLQVDANGQVNEAASNALASIMTVKDGRVYFDFDKLTDEQKKQLSENGTLKIGDNLEISFTKVEKDGKTESVFSMNIGGKEVLRFEGELADKIKEKGSFTLNNTVAGEGGIVINRVVGVGGETYNVRDINLIKQQERNLEEGDRRVIEGIRERLIKEGELPQTYKEELARTLGIFNDFSDDDIRKELGKKPNEQITDKEREEFYSKMAAKLNVNVTEGGLEVSYTNADGTARKVTVEGNKATEYVDLSNSRPTSLISLTPVREITLGPPTTLSEQNSQNLAGIASKLERGEKLTLQDMQQVLQSLGINADPMSIKIEKTDKGLEVSYTHVDGTARKVTVEGNKATEYVDVSKIQPNIKIEGNQMFLSYSLPNGQNLLTTNLNFETMQESTRLDNVKLTNNGVSITVEGNSRYVTDAYGVKRNDLYSALESSSYREVTYDDGSKTVRRTTEEGWQVQYFDSSGKMIFDSNDEKTYNNLFKVQGGEATIQRAAAAEVLRSLNGQFYASQVVVEDINGTPVITAKGRDGIIRIEGSNSQVISAISYDVTSSADQDRLMIIQEKLSKGESLSNEEMQIIRQTFGLGENLNIEVKPRTEGGQPLFDIYAIDEKGVDRIIRVNVTDRGYQAREYIDLSELDLQGVSKIERREGGEIVITRREGEQMQQITITGDQARNYLSLLDSLEKTRGYEQGEVKSIEFQEGKNVRINLMDNTSETVKTLDYLSFSSVNVSLSNTDFSGVSEIQRASDGGLIIKTTDGQTRTITQEQVREDPKALEYLSLLDTLSKSEGGQVQSIRVEKEGRFRVLLDRPSGETTERTIETRTRDYVIGDQQALTLYEIAAGKRSVGSYDTSFNPLSFTISIQTNVNGQNISIGKIDVFSIKTENSAALNDILNSISSFGSLNPIAEGVGVINNVSVSKQGVESAFYITEPTGTGITICGRGVGDIKDITRNSQFPPYWEKEKQRLIEWTETMEYLQKEKEEKEKQKQREELEEMRKGKK